jgi:hypothetical protein
MVEFTKYQHVERLNSTECEGILDGVCHVFPKIDGTNSSVWLNRLGQVSAGSRNRVLFTESDNAGFYQWVTGKKNLFKFEALFTMHPDYILYGEWLVPHSLKTYREAAWKDFYVFDVLDTRTGEMLSYEAYKPVCEAFEINFIPPLAVIKNPTEENLLRVLEKCGEYLIEDGRGKGEGIVIKNYGYVNRFGRQTWGKIVTNEFKEKHHKEMGAPEINGTLFIEEQVIRDFLSEEFIRKEQAKIVLDHDNVWTPKLIPEVLGRCWYEFIREETWNFVKEYKNPKINFRLLQQLLIKRVKEIIL